jgi:SAM-dependent methyltransferase
MGVGVTTVGEDSFVGGIDPWLARLGNLRNVVRQEMVTRQLDAHVGSDAVGPLRVLDVGAGQGTQALRLAARGHVVTAVEPDERMRDAFLSYAAALAGASTVTLVEGGVEDLDTVLGEAQFDVVLCHGVLMYLPEAGSAIASLARRVAPGGLLSLVTRNGAAMAWRPALRGDWRGALAMLDEIEAAAGEHRDPRYLNEIGVRARADTLESLTAHCADGGLAVEGWYGVRVSTDGVPVDARTPEPEVLEVLLDVEERLGRTDPYRHLGTLLHVVARRP